MTWLKRALFLLFALTTFLSGSGESGAQSITGTVVAQNREFHDTLGGPGAKMFAGVVLNVSVTGGQADINYVHRERRECKWYGKCWYERWIDHNFKAPGTWPIEYRLVNAADSGEVIAEARFEDGKGTIKVPVKALRAYGSAYVLQARFAGDIDSNRTSGAFSVNVTVDAGPRLADFPRYLNNGSFLPTAADLAVMLQLDTWSTRQGAELIVKSLINYAQSSFPSATESEEHFKILEIARSLSPSSTQVSRALASHYVETGDYATAGDELRATIKNLELELKTAEALSGRSIRISLAETYAQLAALAEREGSLLTTADYAKMDTLFSTALEHARVANGRDALARISTNRAKILRKSNRVESLAAAVEGFDEASKLLGRPIEETFLTVSPDQGHALFAATPMSTGIVFAPVEEVANDIDLEGAPLPLAQVRTNRGLTPLDISTAGFVLVDDGGVLSRLKIDNLGAVNLETIDNIQFIQAETFLHGVLGRSRDKTGSITLQYIFESQAPAILPDVEVRNQDSVVIESEQNWMYSAAAGADRALLVKRGVNPEIRLYKFSSLGVQRSQVLVSIADGEITTFAISDQGDKFSAIVRRADRYELIVGPVEGSDYRVHYTSGPNATAPVALEGASGLVFSVDGNYVFTVSGNKMLTVNLVDPVSGPVDSTLNLLNSATTVSQNNFGRDNTGAIFAGAVDKSKGSGFLFRLPFETGGFDLNPQRYQLSNRVLENGLPVFVNFGGKNIVGIARPSESDLAVLDVSTGEMVGRRSLPATLDTRLLNGGHFVVAVDQIANSIVLYDMQSAVQPTIIAAKADLAASGLSDIQRQKLQPGVIAGRSIDEWFLTWKNVETGSINYISRYVGRAKDGQTLQLDISQYQGLTDNLRATAEQLGETNLRARFEVSDGSIGVGRRDSYIVTIRSSLSEKFTKAQLDALNDDFKGVVDFPIVDLTQWPAKILTSKQPRNAQVVAYDDGTRDTLRWEAGMFYLRKGDGTVDAPVTLPVDQDSVNSQLPLFLSANQSGRGNLYGGALLYLLNRGGQAGLRYVFFDSQTGAEIPCERCVNQWADQNLSSIVKFIPAETAFVSVQGAAYYAVAAEDKLVLYSRVDNLVKDELPAAIPVSFFSAEQHLTVSPNGHAHLFSRLDR